MSHDLTLHYAPDNASLVVRLALEEMGLPFATVLVDRAQAGQRAPGYLRLNPAGRIPVLETPQGPIFETAAILLWLSERSGLLFPKPGDPARGLALRWLFYVANTPHALMVQIFYIHRFAPPEAQSAVRASLGRQVAQAMVVLDRAACAKGPFFLGPDLSVIDLYLAALLRWSQLYPISAPGWLDLSALPRLMRSAAALEPRASVSALCRSEGMGPNPFTQAAHCHPPEGSAT